jgi:transketolase
MAPVDIQLIERILDIAHSNRLSHLGSYFSSVGIIDDIFANKEKEDIFILSAGHCALALYVVLEKYLNHNAETLFKKHGGHPHRCEEDDLYCSTGSLGMGLTAAVGRAIANPHRVVHCLISDGECAEGSIWESLKFIYENNIKNIKVYVNVNGYAAYDTVDTQYLVERLKVFLPNINIVYTEVGTFSFLRGLNAHYHVMSDEDYNLAKKVIERKEL